MLNTSKYHPILKTPAGVYYYRRDGLVLGGKDSSLITWGSWEAIFRVADLQLSANAVNYKGYSGYKISWPFWIVDAKSAAWCLQSHRRRSPAGCCSWEAIFRVADLQLSANAVNYKGYSGYKISWPFWIVDAKSAAWCLQSHRRRSPAGCCTCSISLGKFGGCRWTSGMFSVGQSSIYV